MSALRPSSVLVVALVAAVLMAVGGPAETEATFPGGNGKIIFTRANSRQTTNVDIYATSVDGTSEEQLTSGPEYESYPNWSADGRRIVFNRSPNPSDPNAMLEVVVMEADGSGKTAITNERMFTPKWSPDGESIVFWSEQGLGLIDADGSNKRAISTAPFISASFPTWSPDGERIAFGAYDPSRGGGIATLDIDSGVVSWLVDVPGGTNYFDWSPDGSKLTYASGVGEEIHIFVADTESGATTDLGVAGATPAWSPDGEKIVFSRIRQEGSNGYYAGVTVMNANGTGIVNVTDGFDSYPSWQPEHRLLDSVEFTQAIQAWQDLDALKDDLADDGEPPVPIVAGKPAAMRVYFQQLEQSVSYDVEISGVAEDEQRVNLDSDCTPQQRRERRDQCRSVDFFFTPPSGDWSVTLTVNDDEGDTLESHTFDVRSVTTSTVTVVPIDVCDHQSVPVVGSWDCAYGFNLYQLAPYLHATFPGQVQFAAAGGQVHEDTSTGNSAWWSTILSEIDDLRSAAGVDDLTFYHGAVRGAAPSVDGIAGLGRRPGNAAVTKLGLFYSDTYMTHELGHNFGRQHVPSLGESGCGSPAVADPNWPGFSPYVDEVGFSVEADVVLLTDEVKDYMSYCQPQWVSLYTYVGILERFRTASLAQGSSAGSVPGSYWLVSGEIDGDAGTIEAVEIEASAPAGEGAGAYRVEARDAGGAVLATRRFDAGEAEWEGGTIAPRFSLMLPVVANAARLVLLGPGDVELAEVVFEGSAPTVSITAPAAPQSLADTFALEWSITDPDGGDHTSWVEYSIDGGGNWEMLTPRIEETSLVLDAATLAGSEDAMFKVIASDGANTGSATAGPFAIPEKPPQAEITAPTKSSFGDGQLVWLQGVAFDEDDGFLDGSAIVWFSSKDGNLGTGASLPVYDLSNGSHTITMTARDSDNNTETDTINVSVTDRPLVEGEEPGVEHVWGDSDCSGSIGSRDGQALSRPVLAQPPLSQTQPCPALGDVVTVVGASRMWGDIDCNGAIGARDGQALLRNVLGQPPLSQTQPCPAIGETVAVVGALALRRWW